MGGVISLRAYFLNFGVGFFCHRYICKMFGIFGNFKNFPGGASRLSCMTDILGVGKVLKERYMFARQKLLGSGCLRGFRVKCGLPCHGQRTQTNAKTSRRFGGHGLRVVSTVGKWFKKSRTRGGNKKKVRFEKGFSSSVISKLSGKVGVLKLKKRQLFFKFFFKKQCKY